MSNTNYKIKGYDGNYYDISGVFSTIATSTVSDASKNPYKYLTANILNNFEVYSNDGTIYNPLQTNLTGYKINGKDIAKYYTPYYGIKNGSQTPSSIPIPNWASKVSFIIQAAGGTNGSQSSSIVINYAAMSFFKFNIDQRSYIPALTNNQYFERTFASITSFGNEYGKGIIKQNITGGAGSGGTCYAGTYNIINTNRTSAMTYTNNNGLTSYLQFNDSFNSKVTVPNGPNGGNATGTQNGVNGVQSSAATFVNSSYFSSTTSSTSSTTNSGYSTLNTTTKNLYPLPTSASFTGRGGSTQPAYFIYWFLI
jgi:hypothetical protein